MTRYPDRIACLVPFCGRGTHTLPAGWSFICARHYAAVPTRLKRLRAKFKRLGRMRAYHACWRRMVRIALARAAGV